MRMVFRVTVSIIIFAALIVTGCTENVPSTEQSPEPPPGSIVEPAQEPETQLSPTERVPRITVEELLRKIEQNKDVLIVDTRKDVETAFQEGHIKGAIPVPFERIVSGEWALPDDKDREIVLYCS
jgi:3-mercaptopyruvate sulfurtransferase SseA